MSAVVADRACVSLSSGADRGTEWRREREPAPPPAACDSVPSPHADARAHRHLRSHTLLPTEPASAAAGDSSDDKKSQPRRRRGRLAERERKKSRRRGRPNLKVGLFVGRTDKYLRASHCAQRMQNKMNHQLCSVWLNYHNWLMSCSVFSVSVFDLTHNGLSDVLK